jgi:hypothetical protein
LKYHCRDLNEELEMMKQLLKEIVKRITDNLIGKSSNSSETGRQSRLTRDGSHSVRIKKIDLVVIHIDILTKF